MDTLDADRNLLFGLLALRRGFLGPEALVAELNAWALKKDKPLGQILRGQGVLTDFQLASVSEEVAAVLGKYGDDPRAGLAALGPIGVDLGRLADPALQAALTHVRSGAVEDPAATQAFTNAPRGVPAETLAGGEDPLATVAATAPAAEAGQVDRSLGETAAETAFLGPGSPVDDPAATQAHTSPSAVADATLSPEEYEASKRTNGDLKRVADTVASGPGGGSFELTGGAPSLPQAPSQRPASPRPLGGDGSSAGIRYRTLRPHAKGGLGEVFLALDEELGREVALKEIQGRHADHLESRARFLLEAEVTGGLEHPGIVPVYGLGHYPDGRPFYAMRFIRGNSFKEAIDAFHKAQGAGADPGARELELRHLLGRFLDVCDAMGYAHARGILHRDIKPANIMLGSFGETLLVDWGLAKALDRPEPENPAELRPLRPMSAGGTSETLYGTAIGTPHYMSPEQAAGKLDVLGPASDIYSLGATLYTLVTGKTPFNDRSILVLIDKVRKGDFPPPREANRRVPPALEAICLKAMALEPGDRYPSTRALADDIEHWLADEPVSVYREPLSARLARWAKRHKTLVATSAALLLTATTALAIGTVLIRQEQRRTEENFQLARAAVDEMLTRLAQVDLADIPQMEPVRKRMLGEALAFYQAFLKKKGQDTTIRRETARAYLRLGDIQEMLGDFVDAERAYGRAIALLGPLAAAQPGRPELRRDLAWAQHNLGVLLKKSNRFGESERALREALRLRTQLAAELPKSADDAEAETTSRYHLGALLARQGGQHEEVDAAYREAIAGQKALSAGNPDRPGFRSDLARSLNNQGMLLARNQPQSAEKVFREALGIQEELAQRSPTVAAYQWQLGRTLSNLGTPLEYDQDFEQAAETYREALGRIKRLGDDYPTVPDYQNELAVVSKNLAMVLMRQKKGVAEAEHLLRSAIANGDKLRERFPNRPDYQLKSALTRRDLGIVLANTGRKPDAEAAFRESLAALQGLVKDYPHVPEYRSELGRSLDNLSLLLDAQGHVLEAARGVREAIEQQRIALDSDGDNVYFQQYLVTDFLYLEKMYRYLKDHAASAQAGEDLAGLVPNKAGASFGAARLLASASALAARDQGLTQARRDELARSHADRALALLQKAIGQGFSSSKSLSDPVFDAIRDRQEFRRIREALEAKPRAA